MNRPKMSEKSPRRMPILFTAERLDYKDSLARTENKRVHNRLELNKGTIKEHESTNLSSMNYEMRRLKHELKGIKQTSGYFIVNHEASGSRLEREQSGPKGRKRHKQKVAKKRHRTTQEVDKKSVHSNKNFSKLDKLPVLNISPHNTTELQVLSPVLGPPKAKDASKLSNSVNITDSSNVNISLDTPTVKYNNRGSSNSHYTNTSTPVEMTFSGGNSEENGIKNQRQLIRPNSKELTKSDTFFASDIDTARGRIHNRLTGNSENIIEDSDDSDLSPYMHVPPDGLPRTVYLLPPLEDLLNEAKKARYIRKLRKPHTVLDEDDPERELDIDEIFGKT